VASLWEALPAGIAKKRAFLALHADSVLNRAELRITELCGSLRASDLAEEQASEIISKVREGSRFYLDRAQAIVNRVMQ
jgi:hypothetical protein